MKINNETKVGLMVAVVAALLVIITVRAGDFRISKKGYTVKIQFTNIDGVSANTPVMLNGLEVGLVKDIAIVDDGQKTVLEVLAWIDGDVKLREGTKAYVKNMGFMGEKYVGLTLGNSGAGYLSEGAVIAGRDPADLDRLLLEGQDIATQLKEITKNVNERLKVNEEKIDRIVTNMDTTMEKMSSITTNVDERLTVNKDRIDNTIENLESASTNLDQFAYDIKLHPWKLMYRSKEKRERSIQKLNLE